MAGLAATSPHPHDPDRVLDWLAKIDPQRLRRWIIGYIDHFKDSALIEAAAEGDGKALEIDHRMTALDEEKGASRRVCSRSIPRA